MFQKGLRVNGEFYVAPAYNEIIEKGAGSSTLHRRLRRPGHVRAGHPRRPLITSSVCQSASGLPLGRTLIWKSLAIVATGWSRMSETSRWRPIGHSTWVMALKPMCATAPVDCSFPMTCPRAKR